MMKKSIYAIAVLGALSLTYSCSNPSVTEEFNEANGKVEAKLIKSVSVTSDQDPEDNQNFTLTYSPEGLLQEITNADGSGQFIYEDPNDIEDTNDTEDPNDTDTNDAGDANALLSVEITGEGNTLTIEELYQSPYDAFESGIVTEYDANGNPKIIEFEEIEYDFPSNTYITKYYTAEIFYHDTPNPYFYTLEAGKIIDVLDNIQLNFSANPQVPEIVRARSLFPVNNPYQISYKNEEGETVYEIRVDYVYDSEKYPISAAVVAEDEEGETFTYSTSFEYVE